MGLLQVIFCNLPGDRVMLRARKYFVFFKISSQLLRPRFTRLLRLTKSLLQSPDQWWRHCLEVAPELLAWCRNTGRWFFAGSAETSTLGKDVQVSHSEKPPSSRDQVPP